MSLSVLIACPDRHLVYDGRTPDVEGIGGGVTARIRVAKALARQGVSVAVHANCPQRKDLDGVEYIPLNETPPTPDVLVATTSGGDFDLGPIPMSVRRARLTIAWLHGPDKPAGFDELRADVIYAVSNFIRDEIHKWVTAEGPPIFVSYNGFDEGAFTSAEALGPVRDPHRLIYSSHPSKGLSAALSVVTRLRQRDQRYHLAVFGGESLWGAPDSQPKEKPGARFYGRVGQKQVAKELLNSSFALCLQARREPFGFALTEAMRAGCIVVASPVGAFPELVRDGVDGFLVSGSAESGATLERAAEIILGCARDPGTTRLIRQAASDIPWTADRMALSWLEHWAYLLGEHPSRAESGECRTCGGQTLVLTDGQHCTACGRFQPSDRLEESDLIANASRPDRQSAN